MLWSIISRIKTKMKILFVLNRPAIIHSFHSEWFVFYVFFFLLFLWHQLHCLLVVRLETKFTILWFKIELILLKLLVAPLSCFQFLNCFVILLFFFSFGYVSISHVQCRGSRWQSNCIERILRNFKCQLILLKIKSSNYFNGYRDN